MLFKTKNLKPEYIHTFQLFFVLLLGISTVALFAACVYTNGSIVILEDSNGTGCRMEYNTWSATDKCEIHLEQGDEVQVVIVSESGDISLIIQGKNGSEPYVGNGLRSGVFTVTVAEEDDYIVQVRGEKASGSVSVQKI